MKLKKTAIVTLFPQETVLNPTEKKEIFVEKIFYSRQGGHNLTVYFFSSLSPRIYLFIS